MDYIEKWPYMVIFQYNLYIFGIHVWTVLHPKLCYNEPCYKEVVVYLQTQMQKIILKSSKLLSELLFYVQIMQFCRL